VEAGADTLMDLSTGGDLDAIRRRILGEVEVPLGTVPIYQAAIEAQKRHGAIIDMTEDDIFNAVERHARDGVGFVTVHCGVTRETVESLKRAGRLMGMVSRGGTFLAARILHTGEENPLYSQYDYLLELAHEYDLVLSLGDGMRPGCIRDATDAPQIHELATLGGLVKRALVTDVAPGYDHIVGAIGGALAAMAGADYLCYVTPSEHLGLPTARDVREGVVVSRIAAHAGDLARGRGGEWDDAVSRARAGFDWERQLKAHSIWLRNPRQEQEGCTMCGEFCAIKLLRSYLEA